MTREARADHAHPCNFRCSRHYDRGWGEIAFEYRWDATPVPDGAAGDLTHCYLYEFTTYGHGDRCGGERYMPPDPPFLGWTFRNPTDGRFGPVGLERFAASQGWAWDRHKLGGRLLVLPATGMYTIVARQEYRFQCELCGQDGRVPGPDAGPHLITRTFAPITAEGENAVWRYRIRKHDREAWMDLDAAGYVDDSAHIGFGPWT